MEFLREFSKHKILRTVLYKDQRFTRFELEIIHTPVFQRLYDMKQMGFADRVYPDAVHSRFNHVIGTVELADRMCCRIEEWLEREPALSLDYYVDSDGIENGKKPSPANSEMLLSLLRKSKRSIRMMALLHDLTHAAYGHTLEDEIHIFSESHDNSKRQARFFDALIGQLVVQWHMESRLGKPDLSELSDLLILKTNPKRLKSYFEELEAHLEPNQFKQLLLDLHELEFAMKLLLHLGDNETKGKNDDSEKTGKDLEIRLLISDLIEDFETGESRDTQPFRDCWMLDIIGNTICADLMDYTRRDAHFAGLRTDFDDRFLKYLVLVSVGNNLGYRNKQSIRLAIQFFTDKLRNDVLTDMSSILKARYIIHERILFHPTKCAADSLLGSLVQLLGLRQPHSSIQVLGDSNLLFNLRILAEEMRKLITSLGKSASELHSAELLFERLSSIKSFNNVTKECVTHILKQAVQINHDIPALLKSIENRVDAALLLHWKISARRFPDLAYRIHGDVEIEYEGKQLSVSNIFSDPIRRFKLERDLEGFLDIPLGSVSIHCPKAHTSMKAAGALVVGKEMNKVVKLRDLNEINTAWKDKLAPYREEFRNVEEMYTAIWRFHIYIDTPYYDMWPLVEDYIREKFPPAQNDPLLKEELESRDNSANPYHRLSRIHSKKVPVELMPEVISQLTEKSVLRYSQSSNLDEIIERIIRGVLSDQLKIDSGRQLDRKSKKTKS